MITSSENRRDSVSPDVVKRPRHFEVNVIHEEPQPSTSTGITHVNPVVVRGPPPQDSVSLNGTGGIYLTDDFEENPETSPDTPGSTKVLTKHSRFDPHVQAFDIEEPPLEVRIARFGVNTNMLTIKFIMFFWYASLGCFTGPILLTFKLVGLDHLSANTMDIMSSLFFIGFIPLTAYYADKSGNHYRLLHYSMIISAVLMSFMVAINIDQHLPDERPKHIVPSFFGFLYIMMRILVFASIALTCNALDTMALMHAKMNSTSFGRQRIYAVFPLVVFPLIVDIISVSFNWDLKQRVGLGGWPAVFFAALAWFINFMYELKYNPNGENIDREQYLFSFFSSHQVLVILGAIVPGMLFTLLEKFTPVVLQELGAPEQLILHRYVIGGLAAIPLLYYSDYILRRISATNVLMACHVFYFFRFLGYGFIKKFWYAVFFELMESMTRHLYLVAYVQLVHQSAPVDMMTTAMGLYYCAYNGVGPAAGMVIHGALEKYNVRTVLLGFAAVPLLSFVLWFLRDCVAPDVHAPTCATEARAARDIMTFNIILTPNQLRRRRLQARGEFRTQARTPLGVETTAKAVIDPTKLHKDIHDDPQEGPRVTVV